MKKKAIVCLLAVVITSSILVYGSYSFNSKLEKHEKRDVYQSAFSSEPVISITPQPGERHFSIELENTSYEVAQISLLKNYSLKINSIGDGPEIVYIRQNITHKITVESENIEVSGDYSERFDEVIGIDTHPTGLTIHTEHLRDIWTVNSNDVMFRLIIPFVLWVITTVTAMVVLTHGDDIG